MKLLQYFLLAVAFCMMLAGSSVSASETITIKDDLGRDVVISSPASRLVFTMENALKTYYAVGDPKNVAALKDDQWMRKLMEDVFPVVDSDFEKKISVNITGPIHQVGRQPFHIVAAPLKSLIDSACRITNL